MQKENNYTIYDNFGNEIKDFDMVALSILKDGIPINYIGVSYGTKVITFKNFPDIESDITIKGKKLFNVDKQYLINSELLEQNKTHGKFIAKNVIKFELLDENLIFLRGSILDKLELALNSGKISDQQRKYVNRIIFYRKKYNK